MVRTTIAAILCLLILPAAIAQATESRSFELEYGFEVKDIPSTAHDVRAWIPFPPDTEYQRVLGYKVHGGWDYELVSADDKFGNRFLVFTLPGTASDNMIKVSYFIERHAIPQMQGTPADQPDLAGYLGPSSLVPISGQIAEEASLITSGIDNPYAKAQALYNNIVDTVEYDKSGEGWGRGDAVFACNEREGNCTDFHSLFIGESRSQGIPARFIMGIPLPPERGEGEIGGYHCWAEFYVEGTGWLPVDASEARKHPEKREALFAGLDADRVQFTIGRDIVVPGTSSPTHNFFIYPYVEIDGVKHEDVGKYFVYRDIPGHN